MTPRSAARYNKMLFGIFDRYEEHQKRFAAHLMEKGIAPEEVERLKNASGLHGNPLHKKYIEMGGQN